MCRAFWLSTHINLNLYLTGHRVAFLRNDTLQLPSKTRACIGRLFSSHRRLSFHSVTFLLHSHFQQQKKRVNDSFAPSDLLNNWTATYPHDSELPGSPPFTSLAWLEYLQPPSRSTCLNAWRKLNIYCLSLPVFAAFTQPHSFLLHHTGDLPLWLGTPESFLSLSCWICWFHRDRKMDSDSDSPFNYSWPSFPKMKIRRRASKQGRSQDLIFYFPESQARHLHILTSLPRCFARLFLMEVRVYTRLYKTLTI